MRNKAVSENNILEFMDNGIPISINGVAGGIIELLIFLTHIVDQNNKIFFIDEPELHLHPHSKRLLMAKFKEAGKNNQIIFTTHSQDLLLFRDIGKITLLRKINGKTRIFQYTETIDKFMERTLKRIIKAEQKKFLFAKFVILVEGDTEFGSLIINYDAYQIPHIIYYSLVIMTSLLLALIWWYATKNKYLDKNLHPLFMKGVMANLMSIPIVFTISILISFVNLDIAHYFWLIIVPLTIAIRRRYKH